MSAEVVGPVKVVHFPAGYRSRGTSVVYDVPRNTLDPRYLLCTDHHVACDCREAELQEQIGEYRSDLQQLRKAFAAILGGHNTGHSWTPAGVCMCTGCQIARLGGMPVDTAWDPDAVEVPF